MIHFSPTNRHSCRLNDTLLPHNRHSCRHNDTLLPHKPSQLQTQWYTSPPQTVTAADTMIHFSPTNRLSCRLNDKLLPHNRHSCRHNDTLLPHKPSQLLTQWYTSPPQIVSAADSMINYSPTTVTAADTMIHFSPTSRHRCRHNDTLLPHKPSQLQTQWYTTPPQPSLLTGHCTVNVTTDNVCVYRCVDSHTWWQRSATVEEWWW